MTVRYFPGEQEAIAEAVKIGEKYGFGNLISHLKDAWSKVLQEKEGFKKSHADASAGHVCAWCGVDGRTGQKVKM